ncbi:hypothetical protein [Flavobacterium johnsoniae]|jgi:hypothetical protein|uniref:Uncharacterized protein n=1 Tax=Flavobacterium johnsoniae (strain ATCC 17061 / DSM 2064 / JCM 8514 / BCRC 14874 / CCUG 350202 / NBRC 14942 / NCIMB 11054 / UW101) TaxID=376686 RepID=A5FBP1_FLAJ1|nr:hypothetical protein [Flavobacterium johnsoniae]ABQ07374.1 hypothetical protein Fjoh_4367 [Flavobacterium johnsoniae UW101]WQG80790.1 hypothetical protein SR927_22585 [Flavobacterium johnsoniae UW101]SHL14864.1 hypothetical protein SAMN05444146_3133 [Flavobacterium johnsoniae]
MQALLQHKTNRKHFLLIVALLFLLIMVIRIFVMPQYHAISPSETPEYIKYIENILDNLTTSLFVSVFIGLFLFYIEVPSSEKKHEIIAPNRLNEIFSKNQLNTDFWYFSGGAGRYTRAETIPKISKNSKVQNEHKTIKILLIDPMDDKLCKSYANFRNSLNSSKNEWNLNYVRNEIIATICNAVIHKSLNQMLEVDIFLKKTFSTLRIDLSKNNCVVTKEDKKEFALLIPNDTFLYKTYKEEILQVAKQCEELDMRCVMQDLDIKEIKPSEIEEICLHFHFNSKLEEKNFIEIAGIINKNNNPYK